MEFDFSFGRSRHSSRRVETEPMRLLVVGDFTGTSGVPRAPLAGRATQRVDTDNLQAVLRRWRPTLAVPAGSATVSAAASPQITFESLDDFHPDRLYARLAGFKSLRDARVAPVSADEDLGRLLGKPAQAQPAATAHGSALDAIIRKAVQPHIVKDDSAQRQPYEAAVNAATSEQMRQLLHHPACQSLEATWRGVHWLTSSLELDERLQVHLFDVSPAELAADVVASQGKLTELGLYRALVDRSRRVPGDPGWSALVALFTFSAADDDLNVLSALGAVASEAGGVVLAGADIGVDDAGAVARWQRIRRSGSAQSIGVAAPRVLLRLPYGKHTDPIESFPFEEFAGEPVHEQFLWGPASLATAIVAGRTFLSSGWDMEPDEERQIDDLPAYTFTRDGEKELQACAERYMSERELDRLMDAGVMPIASRRDRNAVVIIRFQSVADPPAPLAW
jgi:type VI secretion system protein ImpC